MATETFIPMFHPVMAEFMKGDPSKNQQNKSFEYEYKAGSPIVAPIQGEITDIIPANLVGRNVSDSDMAKAIKAMYKAQKRQGFGDWAVEITHVVPDGEVSAGDRVIVTVAGIGKIASGLGKGSTVEAGDVIGTSVATMGQADVEFWTYVNQAPGGDIDEDGEGVALMPDHTAALYGTGDIGYGLLWPGAPVPSISMPQSSVPTPDKPKKDKSKLGLVLLGGLVLWHFSKKGKR